MKPGWMLIMYIKKLDEERYPLAALLEKFISPRIIDIDIIVE